MSNWDEMPESTEGLGDAENTVYKLRLFVTGTSPNSLRAITNTRNFCKKYLKEKYNLEIIDVYQQPLVAQKRTSNCVAHADKNVSAAAKKIDR